PGPDFHACLRGPLLLGRSRADYVEHVDARLAHRRYWTREQWESELAHHGMHVVTTSPYLTMAQVRRWESMSRITAGVLYGLAGRRSRPIEIQRRLGMRRAGQRMPLVFARALATVLSAGLNGRSRNSGAIRTPYDAQSIGPSKPDSRHATAKTSHRASGRSGSRRRSSQPINRTAAATAIVIVVEGSTPSRHNSATGE